MATLNMYMALIEVNQLMREMDLETAEDLLRSVQDALWDLLDEDERTLAEAADGV